MSKPEFVKHNGTLISLRADQIVSVEEIPQREGSPSRTMVELWGPRKPRFLRNTYAEVRRMIGWDAEIALALPRAELLSVHELILLALVRHDDGSAPLSDTVSGHLRHVLDVLTKELGGPKPEAKS